MDYVLPAEIVSDAVRAAEKKAGLSAQDLLIRGALSSRSRAGKVIAMWLPITTFFAHGYEHSVVNMFVIPAGMLLKALVSTGQWWSWNQIPLTLGNIIRGALFTGAALWLTHGLRRPQETSDATDNARAVVQ
jgi:formate/nitrite transporter FocA (FNT family)